MAKKPRAKVMSETEIKHLATEALLHAVDLIEKKYPVRVKFNIDDIKISKAK